MNPREKYVDVVKNNEFPSPTGVNYYELKTWIIYPSIQELKGFPSPTGVNYYELLWITKNFYTQWLLFPSPTGVNYYEWLYRIEKILSNRAGFRPQQGLTIMNIHSYWLAGNHDYSGFRPQQGLTIMNML